MTQPEVDRQRLTEATESACDWLINIAQVKSDELPADTIDARGYGYDSWRGAIRSEYSAARRQWDFFCPVWHSGQAVKALVRASGVLQRPGCLEAARAGADFIFDKQIWDKNHPDHGLILAFEDFPDKVNTSAILECMDGLMDWADQQTSDELWQRIIAAGDFVIDRLFMPEVGLFRDVYDPTAHKAMTPNPYRTKDDIGGRPLLDDGVLLRLHERTGRQAFLDAHLRIADRLVADQNPPGNWVDYGPCHAELGRFHPRHTYWWALPLIDTYRKTGRREFLDTALASGAFCKRAMRHDGGCFRGTYADFNTDSFGHATSGSACAALLFLELWRETGDAGWLEPAGRALSFCLDVQFTRPQDANLRGAILEKILPPDGTDRSPYQLRDLGTTFFVIAATQYLMQ